MKRINYLLLLKHNNVCFLPSFTRSLPFWNEVKRPMPFHFLLDFKNTIGCAAERKSIRRASHYISFPALHPEQKSEKKKKTVSITELSQFLLRSNGFRLKFIYILQILVYKCKPTALDELKKKTRVREIPFFLFGVFPFRLFVFFFFYRFLLSELLSRGIFYENCSHWNKFSGEVQETRNWNDFIFILGVRLTVAGFPSINNEQNRLFYPPSFFHYRRSSVIIFHFHLITIIYT